jgi:hypothetical protein
METHHTVTATETAVMRQLVPVLVRFGALLSQGSARDTPSHSRSARAGCCCWLGVTAPSVGRVGSSEGSARQMPPTPPPRPESRLESRG